MAELVDALASGASGLMVVEVQVLFSAPNTQGLPMGALFVWPRERTIRHGYDADSATDPVGDDFP